MMGFDGMEYDEASGLVLLDARPAPVWRASYLDFPDIGWCAEFLMENGMELMLFVQPDRSDDLRSYLCITFPEGTDEGGVNIFVENEKIIIRHCKTIWDHIFGDWDQPVKNGAEVWEWLDRISRMPVERR